MDEIFRVAFFGHRYIDNLRKIEERLTPILKDLVWKKQFVELYIGRNGEFDEFTASVIKRVQKDTDLSNTALILVLPYNSAKIEDYEKYYDEITIPESVWGLHPKGAIKKKNEWMVEQADLVIGYVEREEGGAYTALKYAKKLNKEIINIAVEEETEEDE